MNYNFNEIIDRHGTNSVKHDFHVEYNKPADALSLWVADMDFQAPQEVTKALQQTVSHGIYGYTSMKDDYFQAIHSWFYNSFGWDTKKEWLITTPGVVNALNLAVRAFTKEGDSVIIQRPVYHPFSHVIELNGRNLISNSLIYKNGTYSMDYEALEAQIVENDVKLFLLCSPHNPVGRVWTKEELIQLGDICLQHNVIIVSDEIHADFTYPDHKHTVLASLSNELSNITITCTAPSKTFNLAGLQIANILIENEQLRKTFEQEFLLSGYSEPNCLGIVACQAAYTYGRDWLDQLLVYLKDNIDYVRDYLNQYLPKVKLVETEGTYLIWLDFSEYNLTDEELENLILNKAKLWLNPGILFGIEGAGFQRMNIASPRSIIEQAMKQLSVAFAGL